MAITISAARMNKLSAQEQTALLEVMRTAPAFEIPGIRSSFQELEGSTPIKVLSTAFLNAAFSRRAIAREKEMLETFILLRDQRAAAVTAGQQDLAALDAEIASVEAAIQMNSQMLTQLEDEYEDMKTILEKNDPGEDDEETVTYSDVEDNATIEK